jgi:hypothetical protein
MDFLKTLDDKVLDMVQRQIHRPRHSESFPTAEIQMKILRSQEAPRMPTPRPYPCLTAAMQTRRRADSSDYDKVERRPSSDSIIADVAAATQSTPKSRSSTLYQASGSHSFSFGIKKAIDVLIRPVTM